MTHGPTLPGGCFPTRKILPPTPTPGNIRCNWGHFGCYNLEGGCCWCSGGTGQAGCSMPIARRTVCTKDYLDQKVHSADREKPCPQAARGPAVRRTLPGLLTLSGAGSLVRSSPLPSDETACLPPHPSPTLPGMLFPQAFAWPTPPLLQVSAQMSPAQPLLATSSPTPLLFLPGSLTRLFFCLPHWSGMPLDREPFHWFCLLLDPQSLDMAALRT